MGSGKDDTQDFDWDRTSFEGAQREQVRRWAQLPLEEIILALEEMQELADQLSAPWDRGKRGRRD